MNKLENIAKVNAEKYYTTGTQDLSDDVFDAVVDEIKKENPNSDVLKTGWGYKPTAGEKTKHKYGHVGSLDKVRTTDEVIKKLGDKGGFVLSAKLDGLSVVLYYESGVLDRALTRGDGEFGVDITDKVERIIGNTIKDLTFTGAVRGEILMTTDDFDKYKSRHPEAKNHRNSAIGLINGDFDNFIADYDCLTLAVYSVVGVRCYDPDANVCPDINFARYWLDANFKDVAPMYYMDRIISTAFNSTLEDLKDEYSKKWNIDGIVISKNKLDWNNETFEIKQTAIAWKFSEEVKLTKVKYVEWNMSKNGAYIPTIVFEPIELAGSTVQRATAFNAKYVKENNIEEGTIVAIAKRGEIIPQIIEVIG